MNGRMLWRLGRCHISRSKSRQPPEIDIVITVRGQTEKALTFTDVEFRSSSWYWLNPQSATQSSDANGSSGAENCIDDSDSTICETAVAGTVDGEWFQAFYTYDGINGFFPSDVYLNLVDDTIDNRPAELSIEVVSLMK